MDYDPLKRLLTDDQTFRLFMVGEKLRELDREVPGQVVACLLYIGSHNPCHKLAIEEDLEFTTASASRNLDRLRDFGLIIKTKEVGSRRIIVSLSPEGQVFIDQLKSIVYD